MFTKKFFTGLLVVVTLLTACAPKAEAPSISPTPPQPSSPTPTQSSPTSDDGSIFEGVSSGPVGIIAIGHSGLTGYGTDPNNPDHDAKTNSWATGTNPEINSIYQRLTAVHPETAEHVSNMAQGGTQAIELAYQAGVALQLVPAPELVIIQTIDNDIRCDGTDPDNLKAFGHSVENALKVIVDASPDSRILMVSQPGRPAESAAVLENTPDAKAAFTGSGMCDLFDSDGKINQEHIATLTAIIESYEAEQARVCATVPQCSTDNGVFTTYVDDNITYLVPDDWEHLSVEGQARLSEIIWPVISDLLELK